MFALCVSSALSSLADQVWLAFQPILVAIPPPVLPLAGSSDDDDNNIIESNQGLSDNNALGRLPLSLPATILLLLLNQALSCLLPSQSLTAGPLSWIPSPPIDPSAVPSTTKPLPASLPLVQATSCPAYTLQLT